MENTLITGDMIAAIGVESEPSVFEIEKEAIRRWAEAIGDPNPLYRDEAYARKLGYRSLVAPPAFLPLYSYPIIRGRNPVVIKTPLSRRVAGGDSVENFSVLQAGDIVFQTSKIIDITEKEGTQGRMVLVFSQTTVRNQKGEVISIGTHIQIHC